MSKETLIKENSINTKPEPHGSKKIYSDLQISNLDLNRVQNNTLKKKISKTCIKTLQEKLRKKEFKEKLENNILYGFFVSVLVVLFIITT